MKSYLMHHGILGQKWGKRNGPPYPLKPSDHSAAEKKKQKSDKSTNKAFGNKRSDSREQNAKTAVEDLSKKVNSFRRKEDALLKEYINNANSPKFNIDESNQQFRELAKQKYQAYSDFVNKFEKENNAKIGVFQTLPDAVFFSFTDNETGKQYSVWKGKKFSSFEEDNRKYPYSVEDVLEDLKREAE